MTLVTFGQETVTFDLVSFFPSSLCKYNFVEVLCHSTHCAASRLPLVSARVCTGCDHPLPANHSALHSPARRCRSLSLCSFLYSVRTRMQSGASLSHPFSRGAFTLSTVKSSLHLPPLTPPPPSLIEYSTQCCSARSLRHAMAPNGSFELAGVPDWRLAFSFQ